jgi:beta-N-acetylhexosaminidase
MRLMGTTNFPHAMAFGADGKNRRRGNFGRITAQEARAIGVHWNFFPDADVNSNPANPIINTRSFGEDPATGRRSGRGLHQRRARRPGC